MEVKTRPLLEPNALEKNQRKNSNSPNNIPKHSSKGKNGKNGKYGKYAKSALKSTANGGLYPIIFIVLAFAGLGSLLSGSSNLPTFESFLTYLEDVPEIQMPFINFYQLQVSDWGFFNFVRWVLDAMLSLLNIAVFIGNGVLSVLTFIIYFMVWIVGF